MLHLSILSLSFFFGVVSLGHIVSITYAHIRSGFISRSASHSRVCYFVSISVVIHHVLHYEILQSLTGQVRTHLAFGPSESHQWPSSRKNLLFCFLLFLSHLDGGIRVGTRRVVIFGWVFGIVDNDHGRREDDGPSGCDHVRRCHVTVKGGLQHIRERNSVLHIVY